MDRAADHRHSDAAVRDALRRLEPIFHWPDRGTSRADYEAMMADEFREVGASGRCYDRDHVLDVLEARGREPGEAHWRIEDFRCQRLAETTWLVTYTLHQDARVSRRSTIWRRRGEGWQIVFHQGTLVAGDA